MSEFCVTEERLALLAAANGGQIMADLHVDPIGSRIVLADQQVVTAAVRLLERIGWVCESRSGATWSLTRSGSAVLEARRD